MNGRTSAELSRGVRVVGPPGHNVPPDWTSGEITSRLYETGKQ